MAYVSQSTSNGAVTMTVTPPSSIVDGNTLVAFACTDSQSESISPPSGFSVPDGNGLLNCTADGMTLWVWSKIAASESGNYVFTTAVQEMYGGVLNFSGRDGTTPIHRSSRNIQNTAQTLSGGTNVASAAFSSNTTIAGCDMCLIVGIDVTSGGQPTYTGPTNFTKRTDQTDTGFINVASFTRDNVGTGQAGTDSVSVSRGSGTAGWAAFMIAIAPSGGGGSSIAVLSYMNIQTQRRNNSCF